MKNMNLLLSIVLFIASCGEEEPQAQLDTNSLYGTWQLIERFDGGSPIPNQTVQNGEVISFSSNNSYSNDSFECSGTYSFNSLIIELSVPCITTGLLKYYVNIENNILKLTDYPSTCDEGCYDKYKRILD